MTKIKYRECPYCGKDTPHRIGRRHKVATQHHDLILDYCMVCRKDYPNKKASSNGN